MEAEFIMKNGLSFMNRQKEEFDCGSFDDYASLMGIVDLIVDEEYTNEIENVMTDLSYFDDEDIEDPLLETLSMVGIRGSGKVKTTFHSGNGMLVDIGDYKALYYGNHLIEKFEIPRIGADRFTESMARTSVVLGSGAYYGNVNGSHWILGAREKKDGFQVVIFNIIFGKKKEKRSFFWSRNRIEEMKIVVPAGCFEIVDDRLFSLTSPARLFPKYLKIDSVEREVVDHGYEYLTQDLIWRVMGSKSMEGLILNVNGYDYKVPKERFVSLLCGDRGFVDAGGVNYPVIGVFPPTGSDKPFGHCWYRIMDDEERHNVYGKHMNGHSKIAHLHWQCHDFVVIDGIFRYWKERRDRETADSTQAIKVVLNNMVLTSDLLGLFVLPKEKKILDWTYRIPVDLKPVNERNKNMNQSIWNKRIMIYPSNDKNQGKREKDFYNCVSKSEMNYHWFSFEKWALEYEFVSTAGKTKTTYKPSIVVKRGKKICVCNSWFPDSVCVRMKTGSGVFGQIRDVPGKGLQVLVYVKSFN